MRSRVAVVLASALCAAGASGCGKKGPPLPPLRPVPGRIADVTARRVDDRVELRFTIPAANADGTRPVDLARVEIYGRSTPAGSVRPTRQQIIAADALAGRVPVAGPEETPGAGPAPGSVFTFVDALAAHPPQPLTLTPQQAAAAQATAAVRPAGAGGQAGAAGQPAPATPAAAPAPPMRYYLLQAVSTHGRAGASSDLISVPLTPPPDPPHDVALTYDERELHVRWSTGAAGEQFAVYSAGPGGAALEPTPLSDAPLSSPDFSMPVAFGHELCVSVRALQVTGPVRVDSAATVPACVAPVDTFPPPAPANLHAVVDQGAVNLIWDPVTAPDLSGYVVLRGDGAGETLQPLMAAPIAEATYRDTTTKSGVRYVYAVVAVDRSVPPNRSDESNRETVVARGTRPR